MSETQPGKWPRCRGRGRRFFWSAVLAVAVVVACNLLAGRGPDRRVAHGWQRGHGAVTTPELRVKLDRESAWPLREVDASPAQRMQVEAILDDLTPELSALQTERHALHGRLLTAFSADPVDEATLAALARRGVDLAEETLDRSREAMVRVARLLTPAQRDRLADAWRSR